MLENMFDYWSLHTACCLIGRGFFGKGEVWAGIHLKSERDAVALGRVVMSKVPQFYNLPEIAEAPKPRTLKSRSGYFAAQGIVRVKPGFA
jgi:hypothetical protein